ncbi:MAG: protein kinase [Desulfomonile tiedjei]|nr:protein kinase [Desulfomonile tiedjei]
MGTRPKWLKKKKVSDDDVDFLYGSGIFRAMPESAKTHLLACVAPVTVKAGERFIERGKEANSMYLIQHGTCTIIDERDGVETLVVKRKPGDLVGEMALCTGEKRTAHVDADAEMKLWRITRAEFDEMCLAYPDLREFITEIVSDRIAGSKFVLHRSVGKYIINEVIGEGGWSIVYKGIHHALNMPVAIKMLKHTLAMDPDFQKKFRNEASIVSRLNHDNIVRVYDIEHLYRTAFIVMECLSGFSVESMLEEMAVLPFPKALDVLMQVSSGLSYAHGEGIIHQDIKPSNIFMQTGERAKIVDFGLACHVGMGENLDLVGTPYYMAPEQIEGDSIDERTDIYSFGVMAFEMVTGRKPFPGPNVGDMLRAHKEQPVPDLRSLNPDLPLEFNTFIQRATQKDPAMRHQSMAEVLEDLKPLAEKYLTGHAEAGGPGMEQMVLRMSYRDADRSELARLVEDFSERLKNLGVELSVTGPKRGTSDCQE